mmetsp:Transcript_14599/g.46593  ORF Transcript_14599/g.46593 Transcript_14599/m.46593 type:complete len:284 (-) Transcript_14599:537-1388(-)
MPTTSVPSASTAALAPPRARAAASASLGARNPILRISAVSWAPVMSGMCMSTSATSSRAPRSRTRAHSASASVPEGNPATRSASPRAWAMWPDSRRDSRLRLASSSSTSIMCSTEVVAWGESRPALAAPTPAPTGMGGGGGGRDAPTVFLPISPEAPSARSPEASALSPPRTPAPLRPSLPLVSVVSVEAPSLDGPPPAAPALRPCAGSSSSSTGSAAQNVDPRPSTDMHPTCPWWLSAMPRQMASPSPVPLPRCSSDALIWWNALNSLPRSLRAMPCPWSVT